MENVTLYRRGKRYTADNIAAHSFGVKAHLAATAHAISLTAGALLEEHHGRTQIRFHNLPSPQITLVHGKLDWFIFLEATARTEGEAMQRAVGIEFGHHFESYEQNTSGPWNESGGLHVLGQAVDLVAGLGSF